MMHNKIDDDTSKDVPLKPIRQSGFFDRWQGLPLLRKDLYELSMRPRTYVERVAYVSALILICYLSSPISLWKTLISQLDYLGIGGRFFVIIVWTQKIGLFLALPALACSCITQERQRGTFDLLRITRLSPTNIILEKFLSRLTPALNLVLISSPVIAFCYPLGGVSAVGIIQALVDLTLLSLRLTAMAIMFSAFRATAQQALIATYVWFLVIGFLIHQILFCLLCMVDQSIAYEFQYLYWLGSQGVSAIPFLVSCLYSVVITVVCLDWGRKGLQKTPTRLEMAVATPLGMSARSEFQTLRTNDVGFPLNDPISWRLRLKRAISTQSDLTVNGSVQMLAGVNSIAIAMLVSTGGIELALTFWAYATMLLTSLLCIRESGKIARERTKQTLPVLLSTALPGPEIVRQNQVSSIGAIRTWRWASACYIAVVMVFHFDVIVVCRSVFAICIYPLIVKWQVSVCDLTSKNENLATVKSLLTLAIRIAGPLVLVWILSATIERYWGADFVRIVTAIAYGISPLSLFGGRSPGVSSPWDMIVLGVVANCGLVYYLWRKATVFADHHLGRVTSSATSARGLDTLTANRHQHR